MSIATATTAVLGVTGAAAGPGLLDHLNPEQRKAVETTEGALLVLAGAGSGKTRVLVTRIAHLIRDHAVGPGQILGITFTRKAAGEMRERLATMVEPDAAKRVTLSTFHALGARILREYGSLIGVAGRYGIADQVEADGRVRAALKSLKAPGASERPRDVAARIATAKTLLTDRLARIAASGSGTLADAAVRYRRGEGEAWTELASAIGLPDIDRFAEQYAAYQAALAADNVIDYADLICLPLLLFLERPETGRLIADQWRYILVDEYQDTDLVQDHLLAVLARSHGNLCVVGDDDQAIYSWRGADVGNIRSFAERYAPCTVVTLAENYRSTPEILDCASAVIAESVEPGRIPKHLWTRRPGGKAVRVWTCYSQEAEAEAVLRDIQLAMAAETARPGDFMILYRANHLAGPVEAALRRAEIPYRISGGPALHERRDVRNLLAYLRVAHNGADLTNFERAATNPSRGIGPSTVERLANHCRTTGLDVVHACLQADAIPEIKPRQATALLRFGELLERVRAAARDTGVADAFRLIMEESGLRQQIVDELALAEAEDDEDGARAARSRLHELDDFALYVAEFCRSQLLERYEDGPDRVIPLAEFGVVDIATLLEHLAALTPGDLDHAPEDSEAVMLMSVHAAKGLEAPRVYLIGAEEGVFPSYPRYHGVDGLEDEDDDRIREERRLFYVALTRAQQELTVSAARTREVVRDEPRPMVRSRFVAALPETHHTAQTWR